ncbi:hypothetical protein TNCV_2273871 [Trichonephila clavipes]|nr:hypothetical protein TNCV_2273871 [Trichonephila clavipes]
MISDVIKATRRELAVFKRGMVVRARLTTFIDLLSPWHLELLHFAGQKEVRHDIRRSRDFVTRTIVRVELYLSHCSCKGVGKQKEGVADRWSSKELRCRKDTQRQCNTKQWLVTLTAVPLGLCSNPGKAWMYNAFAAWGGSKEPSSSKSSLKVCGREERKRGGGLDHIQGVLPQNWVGIEPNRTVLCMVLKATANDRCICSPLP